MDILIIWYRKSHWLITFFSIFPACCTFRDEINLSVTMFVSWSLYLTHEVRILSVDFSIVRSVYRGCHLAMSITASNFYPLIFFFALFLLSFPPHFFSLYAPEIGSAIEHSRLINYSQPSNYFCFFHMPFIKIRYWSSFFLFFSLSCLPKGISWKKYLITHGNGSDCCVITDSLVFFLTLIDYRSLNWVVFVKSDAVISLEIYDTFSKHYIK